MKTLLANRRWVLTARGAYSPERATARPSRNPEKFEAGGVNRRPRIRLALCGRGRVHVPRPERNGHEAATRQARSFTRAGARASTRVCRGLEIALRVPTPAGCLPAGFRLDRASGGRRRCASCARRRAGTPAWGCGERRTVCFLWCWAALHLAGVGPLRPPELHARTALRGVPLVCARLRRAARGQAR